MDVRDDTTAGDGGFDESIELFITSDGTLNLLKDFSFEVNAIVNYNLSQYKNSQLPRGVLVGKCKLDVKTLDETEARVNLLV